MCSPYREPWFNFVELVALIFLCLITSILGGSHSPLTTGEAAGIVILVSSAQQLCLQLCMLFIARLQVVIPLSFFIGDMFLRRVPKLRDRLSVQTRSISRRITTSFGAPQSPQAADTDKDLAISAAEEPISPVSFAFVCLCSGVYYCFTSFPAWPQITPLPRHTRTRSKIPLVDAKPESKQSQTPATIDLAVPVDTRTRGKSKAAITEAVASEEQIEMVQMPELDHMPAPASTHTRTRSKSKAPKQEPVSETAAPAVPSFEPSAPESEAAAARKRTKSKAQRQAEAAQLEASAASLDTVDTGADG